MLLGTGRDAYLAPDVESPRRMEAMRIAVVALGKIGLPLAVQFASSGHDVIGVDVNQKAVDTINAGIEPFPGESELQERLAELIPAGKLRATTDYAEAIPGADAVVLVAPVFVNGGSGCSKRAPA